MLEETHRRAAGPEHGSRIGEGRADHYMLGRVAFAENKHGDALAQYRRPSR
jgi:hypothetical protein